MLVFVIQSFNFVMLSVLVFFSCHLGRLVVGRGLPREQNNWIGGA